MSIIMNVFRWMYRAAFIVFAMLFYIFVEVGFFIVIIDYMYKDPDIPTLLVSLLFWVGITVAGYRILTSITSNIFRSLYNGIRDVFGF